MKKPLMRSLATTAGVFFFVLAVSWVLPPAINRALHRCPVRPDGIRQAGAVPAFARKYGVSCMQCHVSFPTLNDYGRQFKLDGYVIKDKGHEGVLESEDKSFWTEKNFPLSAVVRGRPYQKSNQDNEFKFQALRDVDMFAAGGDAARHVSWFGELEGVSDNNNGMTVAVGDAQVGYHYNQFLNVIAARRGFFVMDPYQSLSNFGSPTVAPRAIAGALGDQGGLSQNVMDQNKQTGYVYGEVDKEGVGGMYYAAGLSAENDQPNSASRTADNGTGGKSGSLRVAFDNYKGLMLGAFGSFGHENVVNQNGTTVSPNTSPAITGQQDRVKFAKFGIDAMVEKADFVGRGAFLVAQDRDQQGTAMSPLVNAAGNPATPGLGKLTNHAAYAELQYIYKRSGEKMPFLVPLVRENWYQTRTLNAGNTELRATFNYVTFQLAHYFRPNAKAFLEWTGDTKQDVTLNNAVRSPKNSTWLLQYELGF